MPQSLLQRIATNWNWYKYFRMQPAPTADKLELHIPNLKLSATSKQYLHNINMYTTLAKESIEIDIAKTKKNIKLNRR